MRASDGNEACRWLDLRWKCDRTVIRGPIDVGSDLGWMEREKSENEGDGQQFLAQRCQSRIVILRENERQLMMVNKNHAERQMLGGRMPSHTWRPPCQLQAAPPWNWLSMWEVTTWLAKHGNPC
jgi:hypothetical protein